MCNVCNKKITQKQSEEYNMSINRSVNVTARIIPTRVDQLEQLADIRKVNPSAIVRTALYEYLDKHGE